MTASKNNKAPTPTTRVAIYTRQSVANDLEFGSIEAQRETVEAYVISQRSKGWVALPERYDDSGFSGGNIERPAFQRMMADLDAGKIDVIAAYKTDRVSRSLNDFTRFMETLERRDIGFVSTTQSFDTRTSMGRLTLNILASFSQFERETIAERTRDKVLATRKKGMWTGGRPVLGYDVCNKVLVVNESEAATVRTIYEVYLDNGGLIGTLAELQHQVIANKTWTNQAGHTVHGRPFNKATLHGLLTNPLYIGKVRCADDLVEGQHEAIVGTQLFNEVQAALRSNRRTAPPKPSKWGAILTGLLRCGVCGATMGHVATRKGQRSYRYYACQTQQKCGAAACQGSRAPADELDEVVTNRIRSIGSDPAVLQATLKAATNAGPDRQPELKAEVARLSQQHKQLADQRRNLLDALQHGSTGANAIAERLGEVDTQIATVAARQDEATTMLAAIDRGCIDEDAIRTTLEQFEPLWDTLTPRERQRVLRLLIAEVRYDSQAGELEIDFRDNGIGELVREVTNRKSA